jgi:ribulose-phosphate 3-epimerase
MSLADAVERSADLVELGHASTPFRHDRIGGLSAIQCAMAGNRGVLRGIRGRSLVAPSILAADFAHLADECRAAVDAGADLLHLDVMDGHFVPNLTMGPALCASLRRALPGVCLDVHLMVTDPGAFIAPFAEAGADHITFHAETGDERACRELASRIRALGCTAGVAINPGTSLDRVRGLFGICELLLVMSVNPGFAGQAFMPEVMSKTLEARAAGPAGLWIQMDGGLSPENAATVRAAGCDVLVAGSALFGRPRDRWAGIVSTLQCAT